MFKIWGKSFIETSVAIILVILVFIHKNMALRYSCNIYLVPLKISPKKYKSHKTLPMKKKNEKKMDKIKLHFMLLIIFIETIVYCKMIDYILYQTLVDLKPPCRQ